jgi:hypothetical protein
VWRIPEAKYNKMKKKKPQSPFVVFIAASTARSTERFFDSRDGERGVFHDEMEKFVKALRKKEQKQAQCDISSEAWMALIPTKVGGKWRLTCEAIDVRVDLINSRFAILLCCLRARARVLVLF